jgi:hypothetical protein
MTQPSIVRIAIAEDEPEILRMVALMLEENNIGSSLAEIDQEIVRQKIQKALTRDLSIMGVIGEPGKLEAMIYLDVNSFWYSRKPHLMELFNFVDPEHRRSAHAKSLINFAKQCVTENTKLVIGVVSNERTEAKVRLYERQLGKPAGAFFVYPAL